MDIHFVAQYLILLDHSFHLNVFLKKDVKFGTITKYFESLWYLKVSYV